MDRNRNVGETERRVGNKEERVRHGERDERERQRWKERKNAHLCFAMSC